MPRVQIDNQVIDYIEAGSGMPVVFIPGLMEFKEAFSFQLRGLQEHYRVIGYDVRRGLKRTADYTLDLLVSDLRNLLRALDLRGAVLCGHSFGGLIAMQFALQYPEDAKALVLVSTFPHAPDVPPDRLVGWLSTGGHAQTSVGAMLKVQMVRLLGSKSSGAVNMEHQVSALRDIARQAARVPKSTINQRVRVMQKADFRPALPEIVAPTLVIAGSKDREFFLSAAQLMYESIPDSTLEVIEGAGHLNQVTHHDLFNTAVDEFLAERLQSIA